MRAQSNALVGDLDLTGAAFQLPGDPDRAKIVYTAAVAGPDQEKFDSLTRSVTWRRQDAVPVGASEAS